MFEEPSPHAAAIMPEAPPVQKAVPVGLPPAVPPVPSNAQPLEDPVITDLKKQLANLREENEKQAKRIATLEASQPNKVIPEKPPEPASPANVTQLPQSSPEMIKADQTNTAQAVTPTVVTLPNPGPVVTWKEGPLAGKFLKVEKGQSVNNFQKEYGMTDDDWKFWLQHQKDLAVKENPDNFSDPSWVAFK
jgi:hypothetical protein